MNAWMNGMGNDDMKSIVGVLALIPRSTFVPEHEFESKLSTIYTWR